MTREEAVKEIKKAFEPAFANYIIIALTEGATVSDIQHRWGRAYEAGVKDGLEQQPMVEIDLYSVIKQKYIEREVLDKMRAEIEQKIEQERFARSVFRGEEKDNVKAEQCTGSIMAYNNVISLINKYKAESEET